MTTIPEETAGRIDDSNESDNRTACNYLREKHLIAERDRLRARIADHLQFRHQHRNCDALAVDNQRLRALNAELVAALAALITACEEEHWPVIADHMTPLAQARAALATLKISSRASERERHAKETSAKA